MTPAYQSLSYYEAVAGQHSDASLVFACQDIRDTLALWRDEPLSHPYVAKLYAELDAYRVERQKRGILDNPEG